MKVYTIKHKPTNTYLSEWNSDYFLFIPRIVQLYSEQEELSVFLFDIQNDLTLIRGINSPIKFEDFVMVKMDIMEEMEIIE